LLIFGVTGNIASGKSTVDAMVHELVGATILDADRVTHDLLRDDATVRDSIDEAFGSTVMSDDGQIDRKSLGRIVFASPEALRTLEDIVHPAVRRQIRAELARLPADAIAVIDAVKLLEGELGALVHSVWWVTARPEQQLERLTQRRGLSEVDARARIAAQPRLDSWRDRVNVIIDNSGSLEETRNQVRAVLDGVLASHASKN
jgi:dephospho-CoA kinase